MGDDEPGMFFLPWPAGESDGKEVDAENPEPSDEPGGLVDPYTGHGRVKAGLREGSRRTGYGDRGQKEECQFEGSKEMNQPPQGVAFLPF